MATKIIFNKETNKYELNDNGTILQLIKGVCKKDNKVEYKLPENSANRRYIKESEFIKHEAEIMADGWELEYKEARVLGPQGTRKIKNTKPDEDYLGQADRELYLQLRDKIEKAKAEELEKLKAEKEAQKSKPKSIRVPNSVEGFMKLMQNMSKEEIAELMASLENDVNNSQVE